MSHVNQDGRYELVQKLLKLPALSSSRLLIRNADGHRDSVTEMIGGTGTTDRAIGDITAEVMITTLGKIPPQMYYLEDTNPPQIAAFVGGTEDNPYPNEYSAEMPSTEMTKTSTETGYSPVLVSLLCVLVVILFMCCVTACIVAKTRRKTSFFNKGCDPGCTGMSQPLLDKISECSSKSTTQRN